MASLLCNPLLHPHLFVGMLGEIEGGMRVVDFDMAKE
jgi:hypothetical protein